MFPLSLPESLLFRAEVWGGVGTVAVVITLTAEILKYFS